MLLAMNEQQIMTYAHQAKRSQHYFCPACKQQVQLKRGKHKIAHFAHFKHQACESFSEGETAEHLRAKNQLYQWLLQQNLPVQMEAYLPRLKQRPDLLVGKIAIEMQCSPLSTTRFQERNHGYFSNNYHPWWLVGRKLQPKKHQLRPLVKAMICRGRKQAAFQFYGFDEKCKALLYYSNLRWHYRRGYFYDYNEIPLADLKLKSVFQLQLPLVQSFSWTVKEYQFYLQNQLFHRQQHIMDLQEFCYLHQHNLLALPGWCYLPSPYHVLFEHDLLILRMLYLQTDNYPSWLKALKNFSFTWDYPFLNQAEILEEIFIECEKLSANLFSNERYVL